MRRTGDSVNFVDYLKERMIENPSIIETLIQDLTEFYEIKSRDGWKERCVEKPNKAIMLNLQIWINTNPGYVDWLEKEIKHKSHVKFAY